MSTIVAILLGTLIAIPVSGVVGAVELRVAAMATNAPAPLPFESESELWPLSPVVGLDGGTIVFHDGFRHVESRTLTHGCSRTSWGTTVCSGVGFDISNHAMIRVSGTPSTVEVLTSQEVASLGVSDGHRLDDDRFGLPETRICADVCYVLDARPAGSMWRSQLSQVGDFQSELMGSVKADRKAGLMASSSGLAMRAAEFSSLASEATSILAPLDTVLSNYSEIRSELQEYQLNNVSIWSWLNQGQFEETDSRIMQAHLQVTLLISSLASMEEAASTVRDLVQSQDLSDTGRIQSAADAYDTEALQLRPFIHQIYDLAADVEFVNDEVVDFGKAHPSVASHLVPVETALGHFRESIAELGFDLDIRQGQLYADAHTLRELTASAPRWDAIIIGSCVGVWIASVAVALAMNRKKSRPPPP